MRSALKASDLDLLDFDLAIDLLVIDQDIRRLDIYILLATVQRICGEKATVTSMYNIMIMECAKAVAPSASLRIFFVNAIGKFFCARFRRLSVSCLYTNCGRIVSSGKRTLGQWSSFLYITLKRSKTPGWTGFNTYLQFSTLIFSACQLDHGV